MSAARPGYKLTEVGVIPEEWDTVSVAQIGETLIGLTYAPSQVADSGTLVLRSSNVQSGKLAFDDNVYVQMELPDRVIVREDDILLCVRNGSRDLIGKSTLITKAAAGAAFGAFMGVVRVPSPVFVNALFSSSIVGKQISSTLGATINQITNGDLRKFVLPWPPQCSERVAIAEALGDVDALIEALEALIAKKRALKQGAMQDLLTGHRRLPGFQREWTIKPLGELAQIYDGTHQTPLYVEDGVPFYSVEHVTSGNFSKTKYISETEHKFLTRSVKIEKGDILMTRIGSIGDCRLVDWDVNASFYVSLALIKCRAELSSEYLAHYSSANAFRAEIDVLSLAHAVPKKINLGPIGKIKIFLPPNLDEQRAIAAVLSDMDAEIAALVDKLAKAQAVKQGMMQVLLTGEIRLV